MSSRCYITEYQCSLITEQYSNKSHWFIILQVLSSKNNMNGRIVGNTTQNISNLEDDFSLSIPFFIMG